MLKPVETIKILQTNSNIQSYRAGEIIFQQGTKGNVMYGIIEGEVEMLVNDKVIETIQQGDVFGQGALVQFIQIISGHRLPPPKPTVKLRF